MNFFEYQARARLRTRWLVALYVLAVALIIVAVYFALDWVWWGYLKYEAGGESAASFRLWHPVLFEAAALGAFLLIFGGSVYKILQLAEGGVAVARLLGATLIRGDTTDAAEKRALNVTAEMAIAAGLPVPQVFVLADERGLNALIAGMTPADAALVLTRGALARFSRDELQAIVAHELSHVLNGDMRLNVELVGMLHGLQLLALVGHGILWPLLWAWDADDGGEDEGGVGLVVFRTRLWPVLLVTGTILLLIGYLGVFLANLVKAAVSREREYLADAEAVQFTRNPLALTGALKKIGARTMGGCLRVPEAAQTSHMFIANPAPDWWFSPFDTHPPLLARIRRFDPAFDGNFTRVREELQRNDPAWAVVAPPVYARSEAFAPRTRSDAIHRVGAPDPGNLVYAAALLQVIPESCRRMVESTDGAQAVLFALLLSPRPEINRRQMATLAAGAPGRVYTHLSFLADLVEEIPETVRMPLADLAVSTLRELDPTDYPGFRENLLSLVTADDALDLFELALLHMVSRRLDRHFGIIGQPRIRYDALEQVQASIGLVLSALAWNGTEDPAVAATAYAQGWTGLDAPPPMIHTRRECSLPQLEEHLGRMAELTPQLKSRLLEACGRCVVADGHTTLCEAETLRAIADALDCPVPPFAPEAEVTVA